jgi:fibronectin type 3 domain-containing protein
VKATSNGQLDLSRISNSGKDKVERYKVYRSPSASPDAPIADLTKNTYLDKSVEPGTTYFYRVAAVNSSGTGEKSVEVEGTTLPAK